MDVRKLESLRHIVKKRLKTTPHKTNKFKLK